MPSYPGTCFIKDRDPLPTDTHWEDRAICLGDTWFNKISYKMFMLTDIKNGQREWEDLITLLAKKGKYE
jgi:hypothetical protein